MIVIGAITLFSFSSLVHSKEDFNIYSLPVGVEDLAFTIQSEQINKMLKSKKILSPGQTVSAKAYWYKGTSKIELIGATKLKREIKEMISEAFAQKASYVWGNSFEKWTEGYSREDQGEGKIIFTDPIGILEKTEISINHTKQKIVVNEKRPIGSVRTEIELSYPEWSKGKAVIEKTSRIAYEGSRVIRSSSRIFFKMFEGSFFFPSQIDVTSTQSVTFESSASLDRNVDEEFIFSNYQLNKKIAQKNI